MSQFTGICPVCQGEIIFNEEEFQREIIEDMELKCPHLGCEWDLFIKEIKSNKVILKEISKKASIALEIDDYDPRKYSREFSEEYMKILDNYNDEQLLEEDEKKYEF
ncbi:hypothetical protein NEF87_004832 [Candidatus Lokiarchaeum ossiferum]|uniref:Uncharacterized protein n=1 Tax=Candidatus Lokiarchaeum ossiferum TaxID=2951803 RepID=A0ABY6I1U2_9ARCH|nr:hypothetical protein NEF87_004832 [Candidatus Lokiarchaeum sp. B-35]